MHVYIALHVKYSLISSDFKEALYFWTDFSKKMQISNFMKILAVGAELFNADGRTYSHNEVNSRNFAKAPKTHSVGSLYRRFSNLTLVYYKIKSSEISPTICNNCVFILRNGFTLHVSGDNLTHNQEYICCIWPQVSRLT